MIPLQNQELFLHFLKVKIELNKYFWKYIAARIVDSIIYKV